MAEEQLDRPQVPRFSIYLHDLSATQGMSAKGRAVETAPAGCMYTD